MSIHMNFMSSFVPYGVFVKLVYLSDNQCNWGISSPMGNLLNEIGKITVKVQEAVSSPMGKLLNESLVIIEATWYEGFVPYGACELRQERERQN